MRTSTPLFLALAALLGACASHQNEPAYAGNTTPATTTTTSPNALDTSGTASTASANDRRATPQPTPAPQNGAEAPRTWNTDNDPTAARDRTDNAPGTLAPGARVGDTRPHDETTQPDNTRVNERDRSGATLTPMDQGNGKTDLDLTQQIRKAVMADSSLSFTAKNVKIITAGGKVTLRGPVKTEAEHQSVVSAARGLAGAANVDDQIEVKK